MHGNYIVIEGLEGAGKTNACSVLIDTFKTLGIKEIILAREPGGTKLGEILRSIILDVKSANGELINDKAEMLIFYAARVQLIETIIKPALANGKWVISDRHDFSTQTYQGGGRGIDQKILVKLRDILLGDFRPNLTLYLDIIPEIGMKRKHKRNKPDRIEQESIDFFNRVRTRYCELAEQDKSICKIDASKSLEEVSDNVRRVATHWFMEHWI